MEIIRTNNTIISTRTNILKKIESQVTAWVSFFILSCVISTLVVIMAYILGTSSIPWMPNLMAAGIVIVSISWWFWTMKFIIDAATNQRIIYKLLGDISSEIESIRSELITYDK